MSSVREAPMQHAEVQPRAVIRFEQVRKVYERHGARTVAVDGLSFSVRDGEYLCIIGRTGCGKSTTLNLLLGLQQASAGRIEVLGCDPWKQFRALKGKLGCIFQGDRLLPWRSILDNVRLPLEILGLDERKLAIGPLEWLQRVGLGDFAGAYPHELSGGMRQRAAMARALVSSPRIILADEAFGHLDEVTGRQLKADLRRLAREGGQTVVHITHSIDEAIEQADRILLFGRGRLFASFQGRAEASLDRDGFRRHLYAQIELSGRAAVEEA
jgi:NitT/TauT family transport system ATP-binding protein